MTRNLGSSNSTDSPPVDGAACNTTPKREGAGSEESSAQSLSLRKFAVPSSSRCNEAGVTSSLLSSSNEVVAENRQARRERVTRSWNGGYGTLYDGASAPAPTPAPVPAPSPTAQKHETGASKKVSPGNVPQQQFLRSLQRASSTILTKATSVGRGSNGASHNHASSTSSVHGCGEPGETADALRRSRIDVLLMPSLKSLVSRRPAPGTSSRGGSSASAGSSSGACGMGGSSSSGVVSGSGHLKSKSTAAMVPLMKREASCASLAPSVRIGGGDVLGPSPAASCGPEEGFPGGDSSPSSSTRTAGARGGGSVGMRKCETVLALSNLGAMLRSASSSRTTVHVEPLKPVNRLRVPPQSPMGGSTSRMCSRCSSLLSMASSSRYSLNTAGAFVHCGSATPPGEGPTLLCKLCLADVPVVSTCEILQCGCCFCKDCMKTYIEFEILEGAYDISCPDAQCEKQGVISMSEIENLVTVQLVEKHRKFRLNREVDLDVSRTWCPRAGCETVCSICPMERCQPQSVHCPTCTSDFCSNCKNPWHQNLTCEENSQRLAKEGMPDHMESGIPFDSDLIKCCPMCNVPIEKDEGCAQMMCKRCKHVFCWYCLTSLDDDFLLRHYDKGPCKNKLGHSRASVIWHRTQVIGIFAGFGILLLVASPLLLLAAPCIVCCKCRICSGGSKLDSEDEMQEESAS